MKGFFLFTVCFVAVFADSDKFRDCLKNYNIKPVGSTSYRITIKGKITEPINELTEYEAGCVANCYYIAHGWIKPTGDLNLDVLFDAEDIDEESLKHREEIMNRTSECQNEVTAGDNCQFFACLHRFNIIHDTRPYQYFEFQESNNISH